MTFFARVTSDLTRSWLLYQGVIFVIIMLFVPDGIGGLISTHGRRLRATAVRHLTLPYLLCLVVGVLLAVGVVFVVESVHVVLSDAYAVLRRAHGGALVPYRLLGREFHPLSPWTWAIPAVLIVAGAALLPVARRLTSRGWSRALNESAA
jgi:branched-chain amino acid transport system permease protein